MKNYLAFFLAVLIVVAVIFMFTDTRPEIFKIVEINSTPENIMVEKNDPNLKILPTKKQKTIYRFMIVSESINEKKYWEKIDPEAAIITYSDGSGFDGKGQKSIIFSQRLPDPNFFKGKPEFSRHQNH